MTKIIDRNKSRQGLGRPNMLIVLVVALILAMVVWMGVGLFGQAIDPADPVGGAPAEQPAEAPSAPPQGGD